MKKIKYLVFGAAVLLLMSCSSTAKFPVSDVVPGAEIIAKMKQDKNKNNIIEVSTSNMASPDRLNPSKNVYVVWITTDNNGTQNLGQLSSKNGKNSYLKSSTPYVVKEIFITAEEKGDISYPAGIEISRSAF